MIHPAKLLSSLGISARKRFSQNFLCAPQWAEKLVDALEGGAGAAAVWEVGPGLGAITEKLLAKVPLPLTIFEIDRALAAHLRRELPAVTVVEGDFLDADWERHAPPGGRVALLSNLPYHLSSEILFRLLDERRRFTGLVLTFQKEFAERLSARPGTEAYGVLSVLVPAAFEISSVGVIPPDAFYPRPEVASKALRLKPVLDPRVPWEAFRRVVRTAFQHRRKKLVSTIEPLLLREETEAVLSRHGLAADSRPDRVPPAAFQDLARLLAARESGLAPGGGWC